MDIRSASMMIEKSLIVEMYDGDRKPGRKRIRDDIDLEGVNEFVKTQVSVIRDRAVKKSLNQLYEVTGERVNEAAEVMGNMIPSALGVVRDVLHKEFLDESDKIRLVAAKLVLGVFGISEKRKLEITKKDEKLTDNGGVLNEIQEELRKHSGVSKKDAKEEQCNREDGRSAEFEGAEIVVDGPSEEEVRE